MVNTHVTWTNLIGRLRRENASLNFFDLTQIKYLVQALQQLVVEKNWKESEFEVVKDLMFNVNPNFSLKTLQSLLPATKTPPTTTKPSDLKEAWEMFLDEQKNPSGTSISLTSLVNVLAQLENKSHSLKIEDIRRKIPEYLINIGMK